MLYHFNSIFWVILNIYLFFQGFFLQVNAKAVQKLANIAFERNCSFLFNMSAPFIYQFYMDSVMSIFRYVNIVVGNDQVSYFIFHLIVQLLLMYILI